MGDVWGSFSGSVTGSLGTIREGVYAEAELLKGSLTEQLRDAEEGRTYFLEMGMTRSLSIMPESIQDFADEAVGQQFPHEIPKEEGNVLGRYLSLLGAVLAVSSNGTALSLLHGVAPATKLFWRMTATAVCLCLFAVRTTYREGFPALTSLQWVTFAGAVLGFALQMLLYYYALAYTSIGNAVIGANSQSILLIVGRVVMGHRVLHMEGAGVFVAFVGAALCCLEESNDPLLEEAASTTTLLGDLLALLSGIFGLVYLTFAKAIRPHMPVTLFMFLVMALGSLLVLGFIVVSGVQWSPTLDPFDGLFGWLNREHNRLYILLFIALVCNVLGTMGFVRAMQYFDNIVIAVATLLEPTAATIIGYLMGVGDWPSAVGWVGNALVVTGTLTVVYPSVSQGSPGH